MLDEDLDDLGPIHIVIPGRADDPRLPRLEIPGVVVSYVPELHPDDMAVVNGIPVTSVARTLVDLADDMSREELTATFQRAREVGLLDMADVEAAYARVEWRPSLHMLRQVMDGFG